MFVKLNFINKDIISKVTGSYIKSNLSLDLKLTYEGSLKSSLSSTINKNLTIARDSFFLSFGELILTFNENNLLESIDGYSNIDNWKKEIILEPSTSSSGALSIDVDDKDDDRFSYEVDPIYYFDKNNSILKIIISNEDELIYKVSDNIFIGLLKNKITSIIIKNLVMC